MKKILISALLVLGMALPVSAANGDTAGKIYSTDIRAYINDIEVPAYNIGGRTAVVIEDILDYSAHQYAYDDNNRSLKVFALKPDYLIEGRINHTLKPGTVIGNIYETDIKTSIYDEVLPSYNIGGKTALVIEDMGNDKEFSPLGGRYVWDENDRTIKLEFMYDNFNDVKTSAILSNINIYLSPNDTMTECIAEFREEFHCDGGTQHFTWPEYVTDKSDIHSVMPININGETVGYYLRRTNDEHFTALSYYYPDKIEEAKKTAIPHPFMSRDDILAHFKQRHNSGDFERFETDDYTFERFCFAMTANSYNSLVQAFDDGTYIDYLDGIHNSYRILLDLKIDEENEKVTFTYRDRKTAEWVNYYEIDLKAKTIKEI